jgi:hypothetical protein
VPKIVPVLVADEGARALSQFGRANVFLAFRGTVAMRDGRCRVDHLRHDHGLLLTV